MVVTTLTQENVQCACGKVSITNGVILEGAQGVDWIDVTPQLLNE
jgi:hypothetical protein